MIDGFDVDINKKKSSDDESWILTAGMERYLRKTKKGLEFEKLEISFIERKVGSHC